MILFLTKCLFDEKEMTLTVMTFTNIPIPYQACQNRGMWCLDLLICALNMLLHVSVVYINHNYHVVQRNQCLPSLTLHAPVSITSHIPSRMVIHHTRHKTLHHCAGLTYKGHRADRYQSPSFMFSHCLTLIRHSRCQLDEPWIKGSGHQNVRMPLVAHPNLPNISTV